MRKLCANYKNMATKIRLMIDKRRQKKDDTYPIVFKIYHNRIRTTIKTDYSVEEKFWDKNALEIDEKAKNIKNIKTVNKILKDKEARIRKIIVQLDDDNTLANLTMSDLISKLKPKSDPTTTFVTYSETIIDLLKNDGRLGYSKSHKDAVRFVVNYSQKADVHFSEITSKFLRKLENKYMSVSTNHFNGLAVYMRTIRVIYNRAITDGVAEIQQYPFRQRATDKDKYRIKKEKTLKRAISKEHIQLIESYQPGKDASRLLIIARLFFLFSFYMRGINFVDMAHLHMRNIENNTLIFKRSKNSRLYKIKINAKAYEILEHFGLSKEKANDYLFPIIKRANKEGMRKDIANALKTTNKYLNVIAKELGIPINLTTYVSRHSWATIADKAGVNRRIISKGLGHADLATTEIYIDDLISSDDLEAADEIITG